MKNRDLLKTGDMDEQLNYDSQEKKGRLLKKALGKVEGGHPEVSGGVFYCLAE